MEHVWKARAKNEVANKQGGLFPGTVQVFPNFNFVYRLKKKKKKDVCISWRLLNNTHCLILLRTNTDADNSLKGPGKKPKAGIEPEIWS